MSATMKKVSKVGKSTVYAVLVDGKEIGMIMKAPNTKTSTAPFQCYFGIGTNSEFIGTTYENRNTALAMVLNYAA